MKTLSRYIKISSAKMIDVITLFSNNNTKRTNNNDNNNYANYNTLHKMATSR